MFRFSLFIKSLAVGAVVALVAGGMPATALAKTYNVDCTKNGKLQGTIDSATDGDVIEITGVCQESIVIREKRLTLTAAATPGPHGITGAEPLEDAIRIEHSLSQSSAAGVDETGTVIQGLTISNPHYTCVRIVFQSVVEMTDVLVKDCSAGELGPASGIWVQSGSRFFGLRLTLNNNLQGLGAGQYSRALCQECDLNGNVNWAASSHEHSVVSLLDSEVNGTRGLLANLYSYIDIDCQSIASDHACTLNTSDLAGLANTFSTLTFLRAGDFWGQFWAFERSQVQLLGARQQTTGQNLLGDNSTLRVQPWRGESNQLLGNTDVSEFSNAILQGGSSTVLNGSLNCGAGGDAWIEPGIDLTNFTRNGCAHAP